MVAILPKHWRNYSPTKLMIPKHPVQRAQWPNIHDVNWHGGDKWAIKWLKRENISHPHLFWGNRHLRETDSHVTFGEAAWFPSRTSGIWIMRWADAKNCLCRGNDIWQLHEGGKTSSAPPFRDHGGFSRNTDRVNWNIPENREDVS